jgi:SAM-dependent methyltransferase
VAQARYDAVAEFYVAGWSDACDDPATAALLDVAVQIERSDPQNIEYHHVDLTSGLALGSGDFDLAVCNFGLSDIDDLAMALASVSGALRAGGRFVASIVHPCFPGAGSVSGSWPPDQSYFSEGRWAAVTGAASSLRRQVGATHRMLSTYLNALVRQGLHVTAMAEPKPPADWADSRPEAARFPVFLVLAATKG